jgi:hypothetical protein
MKPEQQRIAIAEACGWLKYTQFTTHPKLWGHNPAKYHTSIWGLTLVADMTQDECTQYGWYGDGHISIDNLPDYLNDLNAMHEAEKMLRKPMKGSDTDTIIGDRMHKYAELIGYAFDSTAAQRAEAFLRTIGKWTTNQNEQ